MRSRRWREVAAIAIGYVIGALPAMAEPSAPPPSNAKAEARAHFERGVALAGEGKLENAVAEFEGAYRLSPHYSVLFNLGQAFAAMGRSVEAVSAFRRYLEEGGAAIDASRRAHVDGLVAFHEKRIGSVRINVEPEGSAIVLDGRPLGQSPLREPVRVVAGPHGVAAEKQGFSDATRSIDVTAGAMTDVTLRLEPRGEASSRTTLAVSCSVPDVKVQLDGATLGYTPTTAPFPIEPGAKTVRFIRDGYFPDEQKLELAPGRSASVSCRLTTNGSGPSGQLDVRLRPTDATLSVDGAPFDGQAVPIGRHTVVAQRAGYRQFSKLVRVEAGSTAVLDAKLEPTREEVERWEAADGRRKSWALALGIAGGVVAGAAVATFFWNTGRHDDWQTDRNSLNQKLATGPVTPSLLDQNESLEQRAASIARTDAIALSLGIVGGITLTTSGALWLGVGSRPDPRAP